MMISLRQMEGCSLKIIRNEFGEKYEAHVKSLVATYLQNNQLQQTAMGFALTKEAKFFADGIASDFFWINDPTGSL